MVVVEIVQTHYVEMLKRAFEQQAHFACFFAFVKLKQQEKKNIFWITECIDQRQKDAARLNRWIKIF